LRRLRAEHSVLQDPEVAVQLLERLEKAHRAEMVCDDARKTIIEACEVSVLDTWYLIPHSFLAFTYRQ
jgi:hypothetical protein